MVENFKNDICNAESFNIKEPNIKELENKEFKGLNYDALYREQETEKINKTGGSYGEIFTEGEGDSYEVHHIPADSISYLDRNDGPAIKMEKADHRQTASCGNSLDAREYRALQKEYIEENKFREAIQIDIDDLRDKFGDKYDEAISEMLEYVEKLEMEGKINV